MKVNGEAIDGTGPTPFGEQHGTFSETEKNRKGEAKFIPNWDWRATTKAEKIYLIIFTWPADGRLELPSLQSKVKKAYLLANGRVLGVKQTSSATSITLPAEMPDQIASVVCLETGQPTEARAHNSSDK